MPCGLDRSIHPPLPLPGRLRAPDGAACRCGAAMPRRRWGMAGSAKALVNGWLGCASGAWRLSTAADGGAAVAVAADELPFLKPSGTKCSLPSNPCCSAGERAVLQHRERAGADCHPLCELLLPPLLPPPPRCHCCCSCCRCSCLCMHAALALHMSSQPLEHAHSNLHILHYLADQCGGHLHLCARLLWAQGV